MIEMKRKLWINLLLLLPLTAVLACGSDTGQVLTPDRESLPTQEEMLTATPEEETVRANCYILKEAVELFAVRNGGEYPENVDSDTNAHGETVIDLLPRGHLLLNPYTKVRDNPRNHTASFDGQIGYARIYLVGRYDGYVITGYAGGEYELALTNLACTQKEAIVLSNCRTVQLAAEEWARVSGGAFPGEVSCDRNSQGDTVIDLLPGGKLLTNPCTLVRTEPINGCSANPGEIGYTPIWSNGMNVGYCITGTGNTGGFIIGTFCAYPDSESPRR
jgi:hypothetical protein